MTALVGCALMATACGDRAPTHTDVAARYERDLPRHEITTTTTQPVVVVQPPPKPVPASPPLRVPAGGALSDAQLRRLRACESTSNYEIRNGSYSGAYQFTDATWRSMGTGYSRSADAPAAVQDDAARRLYARSGRSQWPVCGRNL